MGAQEADRLARVVSLSEETSFSDATAVIPYPCPDRASQNARCSLTDLFREHHERLVRFVSLRLGCRAEAEEVAQEVFVRLLQRSDEAADVNISGLLYVTARNLATDRLRQQRRRQNTGFENWGGDYAVSPERILSGRQELTRLQTLLEALPIKCRSAFISYKIEGKSYAEIAQDMHLTESMVRKYVLRAVVYCVAHLDFKEED